MAEGTPHKECDGCEGVFTSAAARAGTLPQIASEAIYLSSRSARRRELLAVAEECRAAGISVVSSWLWAEPVELDDPAAASAEARRDLDDLRKAQVFISFTEAPEASARGRGGRHLELGVALALGQRVVLIGSRPEHVFHCLSELERHPDWASARAAVLGSGG